jgi:hypothetical protein
MRLTRKWDPGRARQQPAAVCAVGWGWQAGSGGLVAALRGGVGDAAGGDFEAEGA